MFAGLLKGGLLFALLWLAACAATATQRPAFTQEHQLFGNQLLVVVSDSPDTSLAHVYVLKRAGQRWQRVAGPFPAMIGRNGFAAVGEKREGDGRAPSGLFPLEFAFGYAAAIKSTMPYRQSSVDDVWVDDVTAPDYNTWTKRDLTSARSFEPLVIQDQRYRLGIVTGYNRTPVIPGLGSAIFVHTWLEEGFTTSGCVALDGDQLAALLNWLDPADTPMVLMGERADLAGIALLAEAPVVSYQPGVLEQQIRALVAGLGERIVEYRADNGFFGLALAFPAKPSGRLLELAADCRSCQMPVQQLSYLVVSSRAADGSPVIQELVLPRAEALSAVKTFAAHFHGHDTER